MTRRTYTLATVAMLASFALALWIEPAAVAAADPPSCEGVKNCLPGYSRKCTWTKLVTKYVNDRKHYSTCCAQWQCMPPIPGPFCAAKPAYGPNCPSPARKWICATWLGPSSKNCCGKWQCVAYRH